MKMLIAIDGSPQSDAVVQEVCTRHWPSETEMLVLSVVHAPLEDIVDPLFLIPSFHNTMIEERLRQAPVLAEAAAKRIRESADGLAIETEVVEGVPARVIVDEAGRWGADLILMGAHDYHGVRKMFHHSVSTDVAGHAPCPVEIVHASATG